MVVVVVVVVDDVDVVVLDVVVPLDGPPVTIFCVFTCSLVCRWMWQHVFKPGHTQVYVMFKYLYVLWQGSP